MDRAYATLRSLWVVVEPLLVLTGASLLTLALSLPFVPLQLRVEFPLRPLGDAIETWEPEELADRVRSLGLVEDVRLVGEGRRRSLLLAGVTNQGLMVKRVRQLLERGGYEQVWFRTVPELDLVELVQQDPQLLPKVLGVQAGVFLLIGLLMSRWRVRPDPLRRVVGPARALMLGVAAGAAAIALSSVLSVLLGLIGLPVQEQPWLEQLLADGSRVWLLAPWIGLVVPLAEEVFFRGYVFRSIGQRLGFPAGLLISSVIFAAIHLNLSGFPLYLTIAAVMAWVYEYTGRLASPIAAHATLNTFVLLVGALAPSSPAP